MLKPMNWAERRILKNKNKPFLKQLLKAYLLAFGGKRAVRAVEFTLSLIADMENSHLWTPKRAMVSRLICDRVEKRHELYWGASSVRPFVKKNLLAVLSRAEYDEHLWSFTERALRCIVKAEDASLLPDVLALLKAFTEKRVAPSAAIDAFDAQVAQPGMLVMATAVLRKLAAQKKL